MGLLALLGMTALAASCGEDPVAGDEEPAPTAATVSMPGFSFTPFTTTIAVGGVVTFDFPAERHNVIFVRIPGAPADIQPTQSVRIARPFPVAGTFHYDCTLHPGMSGEVVAR